MTIYFENVRMKNKCEGGASKRGVRTSIEALGHSHCDDGLGLFCCNEYGNECLRQALGAPELERNGT